MNLPPTTTPFMPEGSSAPAGHNQSTGEQCAQAIEAAAEPANEALRLDKLRKAIKSQLIVEYMAKGSSGVKAENEARADPRYSHAEANYVTAQSASNLARAKADAWRIRFDAWRTDASTARARMQLV